MADVRLVAPPLLRTDIVALGEFEVTVHVCRLSPAAVEATVETVLSFGGDRLALCSDGDSLIVVAGAWERHGVCGYDPATGARMWQRKDLKRAGPLSPAGDGSLVAAAVSERAMQVLDARTGESVAKVRGADSLRQSPFASLAVTGWYRQLALLESDAWSRLWTAPVEGFALLGMAFAPDGVAASDSGDVGFVYAFDLNGRERWRYRLPPETLCWALGFDEDSSEWLGLAHHVNRRTPDALLRWSRDGAVRAKRDLAPVTAAAFVRGGHFLVTNRHIMDARSGTEAPLPLG
jgi:hypothetical protein